MTITQRKRQLRMAVRRDEQLISICDRARSDQAVAIQVLALPEYRRAQSLFCFVSTTREIDTTPVLLDALHSGKTLCVPLCVGEGIMEPRQITSLDQLHRGAYGVLEPEEDTPKMTLDQVDLSIIPCVSCDRLGHRLGARAPGSMTASSPEILKTPPCSAGRACCAPSSPGSPTTWSFPW